MPDIQASKERAEARATIRRLKAKLKTYPQEPKKRIYKIKARFIFDGVFEIRAHTRKEAVQMAKINRFMNRIAKSYPCRIVEEDDHFALHGNTQDGKQLAPCDEEWVRSYAADKLLGIQMIDKGCANAEYIIRLRKE